jgi:hypothetical protein
MVISFYVNVGTASRTSPISASTAMMAIFLVPSAPVRQLCRASSLGSLSFSWLASSSLFRNRLSAVPPQELVECLIAGAGRSCMGVHSQYKRPALADSSLPPQQSWRHHLHSFAAPSKDKTDHRYSSVAGCATGSARLLSAHSWDGLLSLYFGLSFPLCT